MKLASDLSPLMLHATQHNRSVSKYRDTAIYCRYSLLLCVMYERCVHVHETGSV